MNENNEVSNNVQPEVNNNSFEPNAINSEPIVIGTPNSVQPEINKNNFEASVLQPVNNLNTYETSVVQPVMAENPMNGNTTASSTETGTPVSNIPSQVQSVPSNFEPSIVQPKVNPVNGNESVSSSVQPINSNSYDTNSTEQVMNNASMISPISPVIPPVTPGYDANNSMPSGKEKNKVLVPILIGLVVIVLILGGFVGYKYFFTSNPVKVTTKIFETLSSKAKESINESKENSAIINSDKISGSISGKFQEYTGEMYFGIDKLNNKMVSSVKVNNSIEDLINSTITFTEDSVYLKLLPDSFNTYKTEVELKELFESIKKVKTLDPVIYNLIDYFGDSFSEVIKSEDFIKSSEKITLDGKEISVKKHSIKLKQTQLEGIFKKYFESIKADTKLIEYLSELTGVTQAKLNESIDTAMSDMDFSDVNLTYELYIKGTDLVGVNLISEETKAEITLGKETIIKIISVEQEDNDIVITYKDGEYTISGTFFNPASMDGSSLAISGSYSSNNGKYKFTISQDSNKLSLEGVYISKATKEEENTKLTFNLKASGDFVETNLDYDGFIEVNIKKDDNLNIVESTDALDISDYDNMELLQAELETMPLYSMIYSTKKGIVDEIPLVDDDWNNNYYDYNESYTDTTF